MATNKKVTVTKGKQEPIIIQHLNIRQVNRINQDIKKWRDAIRSAESVDHPNRRALYDLYFDLLLDAQLGNAVDTRKRKITNAKLTYTFDGEEVEAVEDLIKTETFSSMIEDILDARFWGHTLLEFYMEDGQLQYELIPRKHVRPEFHLVVQNDTDNTGMDYYDRKLYNYIIEVGKQRDLGLFMAVAQYVLYKRGNFGDWAQFNEIFGMPFRTGKYNGYDENTRMKLDKALDSMGSAAYAVIPEGTSIEIMQNNNNGNGEVYERLKNACDEQISLKMLGQTMTTKDGSSLSQAEVHAEVADEVHLDDQRYILNVLNKDFKRILQNFGLYAEGEFNYVNDHELSLKDRIYIDTEVAKQVFIPEDYWFEKYGIDKPDNYDALKQAEEQRKAEEAKQRMAQFQQSRFSPAASAVGFVPRIKGDETTLVVGGGTRHIPIRATYNPPPVSTWAIPFVAAAKNQMPKKDFNALNAEAMRIADLIYNNQLADDYFVSEEMAALIRKHLQQAIITGYGDISTFAAGTTDRATLELLNNNIFNFSAAKNFQQLRDMNGLLLDAEGNRRSMNDFFKAVENLNLEYNRNWQATEWNTAQASSQMAEKWNRFKSEADAVPMLRWVTVGDEHVRESHRRLDGMTAPINSPVWQRMWPPLGWGCRCDVIQIVGEPAESIPDPEFMPEPDKGFEGNPGATGQVFNENHPYFKGVPNDVASKIFRY